MTNILLSIFLITPSLALAGGDDALGIIKNFNTVNDKTEFTFTQTDERTLLIKDCPEFTVLLKYERVPWLSWLPFIQTFHPTKNENDQALAMLKNSAKTSEPLYFGYLGKGLYPTGTVCKFLSRGVKNYTTENTASILSLYNEI